MNMVLNNSLKVCHDCPENQLERRRSTVACDGMVGPSVVSESFFELLAVHIHGEERLALQKEIAGLDSLLNLKLEKLRKR